MTFPTSFCPFSCPPNPFKYDFYFRKPFEITPTVNLIRISFQKIQNLDFAHPYRAKRPFYFFIFLSNPSQNGEKINCHNFILRVVVIFIECTFRFLLFSFSHPSLALFPPHVTFFTNPMVMSHFLLILWLCHVFY